MQGGQSHTTYLSMYVLGTHLTIKTQKKVKCQYAMLSWPTTKFHASKPTSMPRPPFLACQHSLNSEITLLGESLLGLPCLGLTEQSLI